MLYISKDEVEMIRAKDGITCEHCHERVASWKMEPKGGGDWILLCGWCVLYGGSEWGHLNRDEVLWAGRLVQQVAMASKSANTVVPMLDERERLSPLEAEKYVMGIIFTSKLLEEKSVVGRVARSERAKTVKLLGND